MKTFVIKTITIILSLSIFWACSDDFVDVESYDPNSEDFFNTEEDYQDALVGAYDLLQSTYMNVMLGEIASDNTLAGGEAPPTLLGYKR